MQQLKAQVGTARAQRANTCILRPAALSVRPFQAASAGGRASRIHVARAAKADLEEEEKLQVSGEVDAESLKLPPGFHWYETMVILKPTLSDDERDKELAKFEAFLAKEDCKEVNALMRGRSRMAYPMKGHWEGTYVLYTYGAKRQTARTIQLLLSRPEAGSEDTVLRHITFCKH